MISFFCRWRSQTPPHNNKIMTYKQQEALGRRSRNIKCQSSTSWDVWRKKLDRMKGESDHSIPTYDALYFLANVICTGGQKTFLRVCFNLGIITCRYKRLLSAAPGKWGGFRPSSSPIGCWQIMNFISSTQTAASLNFSSECWGRLTLSFPFWSPKFLRNS